METHGARLQLQLSRLLCGVEQSDRGDKVGRLIQPLVPYMAQHSGRSIEAALGTRTRKEIKDRGRWKSDRSVLRYEQRARLHKSFHRLPAAYQAHALKLNEFLPKRQAWRLLRGAVQCCVQSWTKNSTSGFLVGWYHSV